MTIDNAAPNGRLFDVSAVMRIIERRMIKALKQLPVLMASNEGVTETHGTVQWKIFVAGLQSLQVPVEFILSKAGELALRAAGMQGTVKIEFERISTSDRLADAQAQSIEIGNAVKKWQAGFQTWEESSIEVTGSGPPEGVEEPDPLTLTGGNAQDAQSLAARPYGALAHPLAHKCSTEQSSLDRRLDEEIDAWLDDDEESGDLEPDGD